MKIGLLGIYVIVEDNSDNRSHLRFGRKTPGLRLPGNVRGLRNMIDRAVILAR